MWHLICTLKRCRIAVDGKGSGGHIGYRKSYEQISEGKKVASLLGEEQGSLVWHKVSDGQ